MHRTLLLAGTSILTALAFVIGAGNAWAVDYCVDLRTGQTYDCSQDPPLQTQQGPQRHAPSALQRQLARSLAAKSANTPPDANRLAIARRVEDASNRADSALRSASLTSDPQEKAQFKRAYEAAMQDVRNGTNQLIMSTSDPAQKQSLTNALANSEQQRMAQANDAGIGLSPAPQQQAAQPAQPAGNVFSVCEDPKNGVTTCYEMGRTGNDCLEVLYQGGQRTYENGHKTCSPEDMRQRDAYFAGQPVGPGAPADPRSQQLAGLMASLSPQCQQDLKSYLYNSRESRTSSAASDKALQSFSNIDSNQDCKAGFERLAGILGVETPQRHLSNGARTAWATGMADKPREQVNVPNVQENPIGGGGNSGYYAYNPSGGGGFDPGEVLNTGMQVLGGLFTLGAAILGGFAEGYGGGYSSGPVYTSRPSYGYGGPSGGGYVYRGGRSGGNNSTITGTTR